MTLGAKLQKLRKARSWTQEQLSEKLGVSRQSLSKWESDAALPDTANVIALSDLFGVTTDYLLREDSAQPARPQEAAEGTASSGNAGSWRVLMSPRELGARLMVGTSAAGLCVLRIMASCYPAEVHIDGRQYTGFSGFLQFHDLWWLLYLLLIVLATGLVQWFGPQLRQLVRRLRTWLQRNAEEPFEKDE